MNRRERVLRRQRVKLEWPAADRVPVAADRDLHYADKEPA